MLKSLAAGVTSGCPPALLTPPAPAAPVGQPPAASSEGFEGFVGVLGNACGAAKGLVSMTSGTCVYDFGLAARAHYGGVGLSGPGAPGGSYFAGFDSPGSVNITFPLPTGSYGVSWRHTADSKASPVLSITSGATFTVQFPRLQRSPPFTPFTPVAGSDVLFSNSVNSTLSFGTQTALCTFSGGTLTFTGDAGVFIDDIAVSPAPPVPCTSNSLAVSTPAPAPLPPRPPPAAVVRSGLTISLVSSHGAPLHAVAATGIEFGRSAIVSGNESAPINVLLALAVWQSGPPAPGSRSTSASVSIADGFCGLGLSPVYVSYLGTPAQVGGGCP